MISHSKERKATRWYVSVWLIRWSQVERADSILLPQNPISQHTPLMSTWILFKWFDSERVIHCSCPLRLDFWNQPAIAVSWVTLGRYALFFSQLMAQGISWMEQWSVMNACHQMKERYCYDSWKSSSFSCSGSIDLQVSCCRLILDTRSPYHLLCLIDFRMNNSELYNDLLYLKRWDWALPRCYGLTDQSMHASDGLELTSV